MGWTDMLGNPLDVNPGGEFVTGTLGALAAVAGNNIDALNYASVNLQLVSSAFVGTIVFETSNDGVNWGSKFLHNLTSGAVGSSATTAGQFAGDIGARYFRARVSAYTSGSMTAIVAFSAASYSAMLSTQAVTATIAAAAGSIAKAEDAVAAAGDVGVQILGVRRDTPVVSASATGDYNEVAMSKHGALAVITIDSMKKTYASAFKVTPIVGQVLEIIGAAAGTVEINRITVTLYATAAGKMDIAINKRSTASTGGTSTAPTKVPYDAADAAAAAAIKVFTVSPTVGTIVGQIRSAMISTVASQVSDRLRFESGTYSKSWTLTGVAQAITIDLAGTVPTGAEMSIDIEWTEVA